MRDESGWQPVVPSHYLRASDNIVAGFLDGGELALWRSAEGVAQAWENRCPHRGTRLTLGRIIDGRLSCAYHGWEFSANGGRCSAIPAHPSTPAPKNLAVTTFEVREESGMVWVRRNAGADDGDVAKVNGTSFFCRSLGIEASEGEVCEELSKARFEQVAPRVWAGTLTSPTCTVFLNSANPSLTFGHVWLAEKPQPLQLRKTMYALTRLRESAEQLQSNRSTA